MAPFLYPSNLEVGKADPFQLYLRKPIDFLDWLFHDPLAMFVRGGLSSVRLSGCPVGVHGLGWGTVLHVCSG